MTPISVTVRQALSGNLPFVVVLGIVAAGILYSTVVPEHWLRGVVVTAIGVLVGGNMPARAIRSPGGPATNPESDLRRGVLLHARRRADPVRVPTPALTPQD